MHQQLNFFFLDIFKNTQIFFLYRILLKLTLSFIYPLSPNFVKTLLTS